MDSGGWIAIMMIGGTAVVCLLAFNYHPKSSIPIYRNGISDIQNTELEDLRRENQKLRDEIVNLRVDIATLMLHNDQLRRRIATSRMTGKEH